ncbi:MAG: hypothetical protein ACT4PP_08640 [Sporichthyaceae bacterium]
MNVRMAAVVSALVALGGCVSSGEDIFPRPAAGPAEPADSATPPALPTTAAPPRVTEEGSGAVAAPGAATGPTRGPAAAFALPATARAAARSALLTSADFPAAWTSAASNAKEARSGLNRQIEVCLGADEGLLTAERAQSVSAQSPQFSSPDGSMTARSTAVVAEPTRLMELFDAAQTRLAPCLGRALDAALARDLARSKDPRTEAITFSRTRVTALRRPAAGEESLPLRVKITASAKGRRHDTFIDLVLIRTRDRFAVLVFEGSGDPAPAEDAQRFAALTADRMAPGRVLAD